ncbi:Heat shock transcription factor [Phytophthora cinnamomi]|uniref:Heat shock transcription factor n=1 Tax=Phytophthora cinnamomi TaxID=4785 RepID=UPI003559D340|nr:Heat shock transcription factor [Phytophthora cinnamomi]
MDVKRLHTESKHEDEREPEQEMSSLSPENFINESWPLADFDAADLAALDWSLVIDSGREDELNTLLEPILNPVVSTVQTEFGSNIAYSNNEIAVETLPPLDTEYLGESWTDIFDEVTL